MVQHLIKSGCYIVPNAFTTLSFLVFDGITYDSLRKGVLVDGFMVLTSFVEVGCIQNISSLYFLQNPSQPGRQSIQVSQYSKIIYNW